MIVSIPFLAIVAMLFPVLFLCFMIKLALSDSSSVLTQWTPVLVVAAVSWMLSQGLNAMNVQFGAEKVEFIITSNDLGSTNESSVFSIVVTNIQHVTSRWGPEHRHDPADSYQAIRVQSRVLVLDGRKRASR